MEVLYFLGVERSILLATLLSRRIVVF